jgi:FkbM family methyltransferase
VVNLFMKFLALNKNLHVFDIGANLGQYCLYAAKFGRKCIAVEPFYDNYIRLHRAAQIEKISDRIVLVTNGVSDRRGEIKRLEKSENNTGGQQISDETIENKASIVDKYSLITIELDDLVSILPENFHNAIMKIDIEGYELKAFKKVKKLMNRVQIQVIFMEWLGKNDPKKFSSLEIFQFLAFMNENSYKPYSINSIKLLDVKEIQNWPTDIVWISNSLIKKLKNDLKEFDSIS